MGYKNKIFVWGLVGSLSFHKAKCCAQDLAELKKDRFEEPVICSLLEFEWKSFLHDKIRELRGEMWSYQDTVMVFNGDQFVGDLGDFFNWGSEKYQYEDYRSASLYSTLCEDGYSDEFASRKHTFVFMDISIGEDPIGRLVIELYTDAAPRTCENFRALCTGEKGMYRHSSVEEFKLHYLDSIFHRIVKGGWIQGGDIFYGRGNGGCSIYGSTFPDENFVLSHNECGVVSMANKGRHTNGSQFFITLRPSQWMDTQFVAFGKIVEGFDTIKEMESQETSNERPLKPISVVDCGEYNGR